MSQYYGHAQYQPHIRSASTVPVKYLKTIFYLDDNQELKRHQGNTTPVMKIINRTPHVAVYDRRKAGEYVPAHHVVVMLKHRKALPKGTVVRFRDNDRTNLHPSNLLVPPGVRKSLGI